jgi:hypothetical protein
MDAFLDRETRLAEICAELDVEAGVFLSEFGQDLVFEFLLGLL